MVDKKNQGLSFALLAIAILIIAALLWFWALSIGTARGDFKGYWSASYLFRLGENPYDPGRLWDVQRRLALSEADSVMMAWNPPSLFVFLLPLTFLDFPQASATLFVLNMFLVAATCLILARLYFPNNIRALILFTLISLVFSPVLTGLAFGQITFLVLLSLSAFLLFSCKEKFFAAGAILALATVKPHMAILPAIYILTLFIRQRKYSAFSGMLAAGLFILAILFSVKPTWYLDFLDLLRMAPLHWATPTLGGLLSYWGITESGRYLVLLFVPLAVILGIRKGASPEIDLPLLILLNVPFTIFGWSYDQVILLVPLAQIVGWTVKSQYHSSRVGIWLALAAWAALSLIQRINQSNEVYFIWIPLVLGGIYLFARSIFRPNPHQSVAL